MACFFFQHSPMLGQAASSQTVCRSRFRISRRILPASVDTGALALIQSGLRWIGLSEPTGLFRVAEPLIARRFGTDPFILHEIRKAVSLRFLHRPSLST